MRNHCWRSCDEFRPDAWLRQVYNDLALAQLAKDNGFLPELLLRLASR